MTGLSVKECVPCQGGVPTLSSADIAKYCEEIPSWRVIDNHHLSKSFKFEDYRETIAFVNKLADLAERVGHHPAIYVTYGEARVDIWTHKVNGLTENDFVLAAKTDMLHQ